MIVKDEVAHILRHVNVEAADLDQSQTPGVAGRAQQVRDVLASFATDNRTFDRRLFLRKLVEATADPELKQALADIREDDPGEPIWFAIMEWTGGRTRAGGRKDGLDG